MDITQAEMITKNGSAWVWQAWRDGRDILAKNLEKTFIIWGWEDAPVSFRKTCNWNGGDEDFVLLSKTKELPYWLEGMILDRDTGSPDIYQFNGFFVFVSSHA
jgi:hypothetical protein